MRDEIVKSDTADSPKEFSCSENRTKRHPQILIAEAQEIYHLQTCLCEEVRQGARKADHHFMRAFLILEEMYRDLMEHAQTALDAT